METEQLSPSCELSPEQRQMVLNALAAVINSPHFSKSKRYPALLQHAVRAALSNDTTAQKERNLGIEVFGRPADYDTNNDPIVRIAAGEVRRRMALYFSEHPESPVRIELPIGAYAAEFVFRDSTAFEEGTRGIVAPESETPEQIEEFTDTDVAVPVQARIDPSALPSNRRRFKLIAVCAAVLLVIAGIGVWIGLQHRARKEFWRPVLRDDSSAVILVGRSLSLTAATDDAVLHPESNTLDRNAALNTALAAAQICSVFRDYNHECRVVSSQTTRLEDIRNQSVVVIGALDNVWTQRLLATARYQFRFDRQDVPPAERTREIIDRSQNGGSPKWTLRSDEKPSEKSMDYAIIARFRSDITGGWVVIVGGLGSQGTSSAAELVSSPKAVREILASAPDGWAGDNFEAVLRTVVVQGSPGPMEAIAKEFW